MITHRPSGSMCKVCEKKLDDCSGLDFSQMPKMKVDKDRVIVVKCIDFSKLSIIEVKK